MRKKLLLSSVMLIAAISTASAADLSRPVYTKAPPPPPAPIFTWTGFYVGLNAGGKWVTNSDQTITAGGTTLTVGNNNNNDNNDNSSWIAGGQIGYNWQAPGSSWVFGIEGDADAQDFHRDRIVGTAVLPFAAGDTLSVKSDWQASLRGRIGYAAWDRALLYVTGGAAWTQLKGTVGLVGIGTFSDDKTITGGTVGGGLEYAIWNNVGVWNNVSVGVEGRYTWYGHETFNTAGTFALGGVCTVAAPCAVSSRINLNTAEVMGKINFRF